MSRATGSADRLPNGKVRTYHDPEVWPYGSGGPGEFIWPDDHGMSAAWWQNQVSSGDMHDLHSERSAQIAHLLRSEEAARTWAATSAWPGTMSSALRLARTDDSKVFVYRDDEGDWKISYTPKQGERS